MSGNTLKPDNLQKYIAQNNVSDAGKMDILQILIDRPDDENTVADAYGKVDFRERLEFQLDELVRELNKLKNDDYVKVLELLSDAIGMVFVTIENREQDDSEKGIYYGLMCEKIMNIVKQFQPDLEIIPGGYTGLASQTYITNQKIAYLWILGQMLSRDRIGNSDQGSRKDTQLVIGYLSRNRRSMISQFKKTFSNNN